MQQNVDQPTPDAPEAILYVTLKAAQEEIGITRVTLRKYMQQIGITPITWHIGDRSLYISQEEKERVRRLKRNPMLLNQLRQEQTRVLS